MHKLNIFGTWRLVHYKIFIKDKILFPFGEDGLGYLIYSEDGHMSVQFMRASRPKYASNDFQNFLPEEKMELAENFGGYAGRYSISDDAIIHYPEVSSFPNFIYSPQIRKYKLFHPYLELSCPYFSEKEQSSGQSEILWKQTAKK